MRDKSKNNFRLIKLIESIWYPKSKPSLTSKILTCLLLPLSVVYILLSYLRKIFVNTNTITHPHKKISCIVIGNISAGGSGKTPFIISLAKELTNQKINFGIISHGYKAIIKTPTEVISSCASNSADFYGDEAVLIKNKLHSINPNIPVYIGKPRFLASKKMLKYYPNLDLIIFDDGLQDPSISRDLEVVLTSTASLGNKLIIPAGPLRKSITTLHKISEFSKFRIVVNTNKDSEDTQAISKGLYKFTDKSLSETHQIYPYSDFKNKHFLYFAAFARADRASNNLRKNCLSLQEFFYPDHYPLGYDEIATTLKNLPIEVINNAIVIVSEKDAVKLFYNNKKIIINVPIMIMDYSLIITKHLFDNIINKASINHNTNQPE